jgi:hypothetical protein
MVSSVATNAKSLSEFINVLKLGNGAKTAIALTLMGEDITDKGLYRSFGKHWGYKLCATLARKHAATMPKAELIKLFELEAECADLFTTTYQQGMDSNMGDKASTELAKAAVQAKRDEYESDNTPEPTPAKTSSKVAPYGKPETLNDNTTFKFEGGNYKVVKRLTDGSYRINVMPLGVKSIKYVGQQFKIGTFTMSVVKFVSDNSFNAIMVETPKAESVAPIASEKKTRKAKASAKVEPTTPATVEERVAGLESGLAQILALLQK